MAYTGPGERVQRTAVRVFTSNSPVVVNGVPGWGAKVAQLDRFVNPASAAATQVQIGEAFTHFVVGVHELPAAGLVAGAVVGSKIWIDPDDDVVKLTPAAGDLPLGVVDEIDASRTPAVLRVNMNERWAFTASGGTSF